MTEARGYLQKAPREGAADLVACASVTVNSLPLARSLCVDLLTFWPSSPLPGTVEGVSSRNRRTEKERERGKVERKKEKRNRMNGTSSRR